LNLSLERRSLKKKPLSYLLYRFGWSALDLLFPPACGGCGKLGSRWCAECQKKVKILSGTLCDVCGLPQDVAGVCETCREAIPHFRALRAWAVFEGPLRQALLKLKYKRDMSMGDAIAAQMIPFVESLNWKVDMLIPIPLGKQRLKERGYNQVGMVAKPLTLALKIQYAPHGLMRQKETRSQVGLSRQERKENIHAAFRAGADVRGRNILLFDDVATTGSTLSPSADAQLDAGASEVYALTVARALPQHGLKHV
jgi:ComF family protein